MGSRRAVSGAVAALLGAALFTVGCSSSASNTAAEATTTTARTTTTMPKPTPKQFAAGDDTFRTIPDPIPAGTHGDLLRYQKIADPPEGLRWYRIMYLSDTVAGKPTVETGVITIPDGPTPKGGWKLATHAHGSTGLADDCAPSRTIADNRSSAAELMVVRGRPFLEGTSEGRAVLDAARAARQFPGLDLPEQIAIVGYSQGGHAALWANQIAARWTPELHVLGTVAGAPASEVAALIASATPDMDENGQALAVMAGITAADPGLQRDLDRILTPGGKAVLKVLDASCTTPADFKPAPPFFTSDPLTTEPWKRLFVENTPGSVATDDPILIIHSAEDESVPIAQSAALLRRLCAHGQTVERRVLDDGSHVAAAVPAYQQGFEWLDGLAEGTRPVSSCGDA